MPEPKNPNGIEAPSSLDKTTKKPEDTKKQKFKNEFLDIAALIRSIQIAEGENDCFQKTKDHCEQLDCCWRIYCLGNNKPIIGEG